MKELSLIEEINYEILLNLDYKSIFSFFSTSKQYYKLCTNDYFWKRMVQRDYPQVFTYKPNKITFREMYKNMYRGVDYINNIIEDVDMYIIIWYHIYICEIR
jgi:hypothetical protein